MSLKFILYKIYYSAPRKIKCKFFIYWNRFIFWLAGVNFQDNMRVYNKFYIHTDQLSTITIGKNFEYSSGNNTNRLARNLMGGICAENATINIGNNVGISSSSIRAKHSITIKDNVKIGADCIILDTDSHSLNYLTRRTKNEGKSAVCAPIVIEEDVLIGTRCIILKGVTIGARSIIGAGSVVTKSIPSDSIAAGNPCKVIRTFTY